MKRLAYSITLLSLLSAAYVAAAPGDPAPPLTATFETLVRARGAVERERWTLTREAGRVAYKFGSASDQRVDVWSRGPRELRLLRVFPHDKTSVEYSEGQLRALGSFRSWQQLTSLLPQAPAQLGLKATGTGSWQQHTTLRFEGELEGAHVSVEWLEAEQLPVVLTRKSARGERAITLQKLSAGGAAIAPDAALYRRIDAADLGDLEHDPFVHRHSALLNAGHPL